MKCLHCRNPLETTNALFCSPCLNKFHKMLLSRLIPPQSFDQSSLISFGFYDGPLATFIKSAKSQPFGYLAPPYWSITKSLCQHWRDCLEPTDFVASVPGQPLRCLIQSDFGELLSICISQALGRPILKKVIRRAWSSPQKKRQSRIDRWQSCRAEQFSTTIPKSKRKQGRVLLVDDVCTTGSSLITCSKLLRAAGYEVSQCLTFARSQRFFYDYPYGTFSHENHD